MSAKFSRSGSPASIISIPDNPLLNIPGDVAFGVTISFDGLTNQTSGGYQSVFEWGPAGGVDNVRCSWYPLNATSNPGKFWFQLDTSAGNECYIGPTEAGQSYQLVIQRSAGVWQSKLCAIQTSAPANGSMVLTSAGYTNNAVLDAPYDLVLGYNSTASRRLDQSLFRFFRVSRSLTDFEIAQLAYGKEITTFVTPDIYLRLDGPEDYLNTGSQTHTVTAAGLTQGTDPGFGFSSTPVAPAIIEKPVIIGSPSIGNATSYTQALATGNPSPTITQQWTIAASAGAIPVDIPDATGLTYTPVASDAGKLLRVREIASNGVNPVATSTSDPVVVAANAVTIAPQEIPAEAIFQHVNRVAVVPVSVSFTGTAPTKMEYQLYDADGTTVTKAWADSLIAPANSKFAGNVLMPVPTNGRKSKIAYRTKDANGNVMATSLVMSNRFGIGGIMIGLGSSSMTAWFGDGSGAGMIVDHNAVSTDGMSSSTTSPFSWALFGTVGQAGQMAMHFATELGYPIGFIQHAMGGSTLATWTDPTSSLNIKLLEIIAAVGGKLEGIISTAGSNDITGANGGATVEGHLTKLRTLAAQLRSAGVTNQPTLPILLSGINRRTNANSDLQAQNARKAESTFGLESPYNLHVQTLDFQLGSDGTHLVGSAFGDCTRRVRYVWVEYMKYGIKRNGPTIASSRFNGSQINVVITHHSGNDYTPLTGIQGFKVTDNKGDGVQVPVVITSCVRTDPTNILISCDQTLVQPTVTYMAGQNPDYPAQVFDNGPTILPMIAEPYMTTVAGTIEQPKVLVPYYNTYTFDRAVVTSGGTTPPDPTPPVVTTGSFTTWQMHSSGTLRVNQAFKYEWHSGGVLGQTVGNVTMGNGVTNNLGQGILNPLPLGPGYGLFKTSDGGVFYQEGTVT